MINASSAPSDPSDATPAAIEVALLQSWLASSSALQSCSCKRQLDQFRSTQPRRTKLPESLWQAAVELARQHGVYSVVHPLRLDYVSIPYPNGHRNVVFAHRGVRTLPIPQDENSGKISSGTILYP